MINTVQAATSIADPAFVKPSATAPSAEGANAAPHTDKAAPAQPKPAAPPAAPKSDPDLRLVIERAQHAAFYVYKLIDRNTGDVVTELPRNDVQQMANSPSYAAGDVVKTKA